MSDSSIDVPSHDESDLPPHTGSVSLGELRNLILGEEIDRRIRDYQVNPEQIAEILPDAVTLTHQDAESMMVEAVRPTVEHAIKDSINLDQEILADALFPVIGPATRKAVTTAIKTLTDSLNQGLEMSLSPESVGWRIEAWRTGRSFAEVALLRGQLFQVQQVLLIHKETGLMLEEVEAEKVAFQDPELISAMLTAIEDFVKDSFATDQEKNKFLDSVKVGNLNLWIEDSPQTVLACVIQGNAPKNLRAQMANVQRLIHRQYSSQLKAFSGDRTPFESTKPNLKTCLLSQSKPKPTKKRSPLFWIAGVLFIVLLLFLARTAYLQHQWKSALNALEEKPGIMILKAHRGWTRSHIKGLRDPLALDPQSVIEKYGLKSDTVNLEFEPYLSLTPQLLEQEAKRFLGGAPNNVVFNYDPETLTLRLSGQASQQWIEQAKKYPQGQPRVQMVDTTGLDLSEADKLLNLKNKVESTVFVFREGSSDLQTADTQRFTEFLNTMQTMIQLARQINQSMTIQILGQASPRGQFEDNARLSQSRADLIMRRLIHKGIPAQLMKSQGIGVTSDSVDKSLVQKAQVTFRVNFQQP